MTVQYDQVLSNDDINNITGKQNEVKQILSDEISRLKAKKDNMDVENHNRDRMIMLNQSYRDKQREYLLIMVIFLILFGIALGLVFLQERLGISTFVLDWIIVFIVAFGLISGIKMYMNIKKRDAIDFSKISQTAGSLLNVNKDSKEYSEASKEGRVSDAVAETCQGAACCGPGYSYNSTDHKCEKNS